VLPEAGRTLDCWEPQAGTRPSRSTPRCSPSLLLEERVEREVRSLQEGQEEPLTAQPVRLLPIPEEPEAMEGLVPWEQTPRIPRLPVTSSVRREVEAEEASVPHPRLMAEVTEAVRSPRRGLLAALGVLPSTHQAWFSVAGPSQEQGLVAQVDVTAQPALLAEMEVSTVVAEVAEAATPQQTLEPGALAPTALW